MKDAKKIMSMKPFGMVSHMKTRKLHKLRDSMSSLRNVVDGEKDLSSRRNYKTIQKS